MTRCLRVFTSLDIFVAVGCPNSFFPSGFYSDCLAVAVSLCVPSVFIFSSKSLYEEPRKVCSSAPPLHYHWKSLAPVSF